MANPKFVLLGDLVRIKSLAPLAIGGSVVEVQGNRARIGKQPDLARWVTLEDLQLCMLTHKHFAIYLLDGRKDGWVKTERWFAKYRPDEIQDRILLRLSGEKYMRNVLEQIGADAYLQGNLRQSAQQVYQSLVDLMSTGYFFVEGSEQAA